MKAWQAGILSALLGLTLWQSIVWAGDLQKFILPGPGLVAETLWKSRVIILENTWVTLIEVALGLVLGALIGGTSAILLASSPVVRDLVRPLLLFGQAIPVLALAPILNLWFGFGMTSKVIMSLIIVYFPVTSAFFDALVRTNTDWVGLARVMGASRWRTMLHIRIPAAAPGFASGLRLSAVYAPIGAIIGEWVGASKGLGYLMLLANGRAKTELMFAALFVLALMTICLYALTDQFCKRYLDRAGS
ncbi:MAG: ABC transporter permease [Alphaproteobacteria bacterium]